MNGYLVGGLRLAFPNPDSSSGESGCSRFHMMALSMGDCPSIFSLRSSSAISPLPVVVPVVPEVVSGVSAAFGLVVSEVSSLGRQGCVLIGIVFIVIVLLVVDVVKILVCG